MSRNLEANAPIYAFTKAYRYGTCKKAKSGDTLAFRVIYHRYWRRIYGFVYQQLGYAITLYK